MDRWSEQAQVPGRTQGEPVGSGLTVRVVGGPCAVIELGGVRMLTDPTFSPAGVHESAPGRPLTKTEDPAFGIEAVGPIDVVLLSHDQHADNLDPAGRQVVGAVPLTLTTQSAADRLGGTAQALASWHHVVVPRPDGGGIEVTAVPARHGPVGCEPLTGEVTGFVLRGDGIPTVYISGDNAALENVQEIAQRVGSRRKSVTCIYAGSETVIAQRPQDHCPRHTNRFCFAASAGGEPGPVFRPWP